jgi:benzoyl-CoA reductase subunit D
MITAGIDCGAKNTKSVILEDQEVIGRGMVRTGFDQEKSAAESLEKAIRAAGIGRDDIQRIGGTGSGKKAVQFADDDVDDIRAMSRGAIFFFPDARTVVDVGAEEGRAAKIDEKGNPVDFEINDKCAAGAGAFIEAMSRALGVTIEQMGPLALQSDKKIPMNAQCVVFAESEVVGLIHAKTARQDISKAIHDAMAGRIMSLVRRIGINQDVAMVGGVGYNPGIRAAMLRELKVENLYVPADPEFGSAVGAAVVAAEKAECQ